MRLINLELNGFKSFAKKTSLEFGNSVVSIVGPNGSGKSNVVEAFRFVLGEQSMKSMRGKQGADLIFKGSKNLPKGTKASVTIYFDNSDKVFKLGNDEGENMNLNFETISISREVHADGRNIYILNGSEVRLKDINALLASVNIGSSGHHIISQGEADRVLNASPRERKEMVEDALGLKVYQYKIKEADRKLERTTINMKEVVMLRRENAPHLAYLKRQVEKVEKMKELRVELLGFYREYLKKESVYLENQKGILKEEKDKVSSELSVLNNALADKFENESNAENAKLEELKKVETNIANVRRLKGEIERKLGRIEGMIEAEAIRAERAPEVVAISQSEMKEIVDEVNALLNDAFLKEDVSEIKDILNRIKESLKRFSQNKENKNNNNTSDIENLRKTQLEVSLELQKLQREEDKLSSEIVKIKQDISQEIEEGRDKEREKFTLKVRQQELTSALDLINVKEENLARENESFENELKEGSVLVGHEILSYKNFEFNGDIDRTAQEEQRKKIERIKIKLEDSGLAESGEVLKEYKEMTERDEFLAKELEDLNVSIESLKTLMADLKEKIDIEFKEGIKKINVEFGNFFALMFGGGTGSLHVVVENKKRRGGSEDEEEIGIEEEEKIELEQGIEINVSLPHKKVKELQSLSGGERSLTSIALLFAMSQVNPPPFLILDETDAALDEANSRKYGDMIERLSKRSQLIVVTHNRETMSRAGVLYGVTIGADGASKLLSVKFDEAVSIAK
ncbi:MAG: AAA family ATPase [Candidatus Pacebacteria bacterium]|nr:AAA family ATPase [Candidatus Paceibacterota bacterium]